MMLTLFTAMAAVATSPAAPATPAPCAPVVRPVARPGDGHLDELRHRAREIEETIKDLHRELEEIERMMEREMREREDEERGAAVWLEDLGEAEGAFIVQLDGTSGRQVMVDGERSELIERLVEELGERGGPDGERMRRVIVRMGEGEPLVDLVEEGMPGGVFVFEADEEEHHGDHDGEHHREMVREFEFPGGHGEVHVGVELHGDHGFDGDLEEMLEELEIDLDELTAEGLRQRMIRIGARRGHDEEHDHDGHHEGHHEEHDVHHFEFPGGHGEVHVVEMHGDHGHDDHGHGVDLEEMLHELGIDPDGMDGREVHVEVEIESDDEHGHHVEHRVIRIGGEHGHHEEHHEEECDGEECEDEDDHHEGRWHDGHHDDDDHDGHHEGHDGHPEEVVVIGPGLDRRVRLRSNAPVPIEFDLEELELGPGVVDLSRRADGRRRVRMEQRRSDPRERREIMEGMRRRAMERQAQADRGGFPEEMQRAMRELQEEMRAMRREMNEMQRRFRQR